MDQDKVTPNAQGYTKSNGKWQAKKDAAQDQILDTAKQTYERIVDSASESLTSASETLSSVSDRAATVVRQYPIQIAVGALAVGFLLGSAFRRTRV
jgi:hypothetical protein